MAKKSVGGTGKGLIGGMGVFGTPTAKNYGGKLQRGGKGLTGGRGVFGTPTKANYGGKLQPGTPTATSEKQISPPQKSISLTGGLGMQGYRGTNAKTSFVTPRNATTATRNYQYGEVLAPTKQKPNVVRTATNMKTTLAKAAAPKRMAVNPRTGSTLGFTTGGKTGSTATKSGTAFRTPMTPGQRASRASFDRSGVAGPQKDSSGRNRSSAAGKGAFGGGKKR